MTPESELRLPCSLGGREREKVRANVTNRDGTNKTQKSTRSLLYCRNTQELGIGLPLWRKYWPFTASEILERNAVVVGQCTSFSYVLYIYTSLGQMASFLWGEGWDQSKLVSQSGKMRYWEHFLGWDSRCYNTPWGIGCFLLR